MQHLPSDPEHESSQQHYAPHVLDASHPEYKLPHHAETCGQDEGDAGALAVDEDAAQERDDDVGQGVEGIEEVELGFGHMFLPLIILVVLDGVLEGLR